MALQPNNSQHEQQINAGILGRNIGHKFEETLTNIINNISWENNISPNKYCGNLFCGNPAKLLVEYIIEKENLVDIQNIKASWLGGLATSGKGSFLLDNNGNQITKSKSDILLQITTERETKIIGLSVKSCNTKSPTNAQLYFSTASAFAKLLRDNDITISQDAENAMKMFCGDNGFMPLQMIDVSNRLADHRRFFWEELPSNAKIELETLFTEHQNSITKLLLQKAYRNDDFAPTYLLHKTRKATNFEQTEIALYKIDELLDKSKSYATFVTKPYKIHKGTYKNDPNEHQAPRFGIVQMQRGGQKQHPTQLQFNLQAGYFYALAAQDLM
jgi:hypothetical protein